MGITPLLLFREQKKPLSAESVFDENMFQFSGMIPRLLFSFQKPSPLPPSSFCSNTQMLFSQRGLHRPFDLKLQNQFFLLPVLFLLLYTYHLLIFYVIYLLCLLPIIFRGSSMREGTPVNPVQAPGIASVQTGTHRCP